MPEVMMQAFAARQMKTAYTLTVWKRALSDVQKGRRDVVLGIDANDLPLFLTYKGFYVFDETVFITKLADNIILDKPEDLFNYQIGTIADYAYANAHPWERNIVTHQKNLKVYSDYGERKLLSLLLMGRLDISIGNYDVARMYLSKVGRLDEVKFFHKGMLFHIYAGFTKSLRGEMLTREFSKGFQTILKNGTLKKIFDTYDIEIPNYELQTIQE